jgi:hypothetical protein
MWIFFQLDETVQKIPIGLTWKMTVGVILFYGATSFFR